MKKYWVLRVLVGVGILLFLIYKLNIKEIANTLFKTNLYVILLFLAIYIIPLIINTLNLKILSHTISSNINILTLFKYNLLSFSLGLFSPARIGELSIVYLLKKQGLPYGKGAALMIVSKLIRIITFVTLGIFGFFIFFSRGQAIRITLVVVSLLFIFCILMMSTRARNIIKKYVLKSYSSKFKGFSKSLFHIIKKKKILLLTFIISLIGLFITSFIFYIIFLFFGLKVPFLAIPTIRSMGALSSLIPISISGIGVRESLIIYSYSKINVDATIVGAIYLLGLFLNYVVSGLIIILTKIRADKRTS